MPGIAFGRGGVAASVIRSIPDIGSVEWLRTSGVRIGIVLALGIVVSWVGSMAVKRLRRRLEGSPSLTVAINLQRATTIASILTNLVRVVVWSIAVLLIMGELGLNLAPLLAGAGVLGLALGFGAQTLVRDFLAGFFVLTENQFGVGDVVTLVIGPGGGEFSGRIERVSLRSTSFRATDGTLATVGNGYLLLVNNRSRGRGQVSVEVRVPQVQDLGEVERKLDHVVGELRRDPHLQRLLSAGPEPVGVEPTGGNEVVVTVEAETRPSRRDEVERELRRQLNRRFLPFPAGAEAPRDEDDARGL
jgi:small conductance mechanosensitive channel